MLRGLLGAVSWLPILDTTSDTGHTAGEVLYGVNSDKRTGGRGPHRFRSGTDAHSPESATLPKCGSDCCELRWLEKPDVAGKSHHEVGAYSLVAGR